MKKKYIKATATIKELEMQTRVMAGSFGGSFAPAGDGGTPSAEGSGFTPEPGW